MAFQLELAPLNVEDYFAPLLNDALLFGDFRRGPQSRCARPNNSQRQELFNLIQEAKRRREERSDHFEFNVDVQGYSPADLAVSVEDNFLTVTGKHEEQSEDGSRFVSRQFTRKQLLPKEVDLDAIKSSLANDGSVLRVEAPIKKAAIEAPKEHVIPVTVVRPEDKNLNEGAVDNPTAA